MTNSSDNILSMLFSSDLVSTLRISITFLSEAIIHVTKIYLAWNLHLLYSLTILMFLKNSACTAPLGMESEAIFDEQISASSQWDDEHSAQQARLHSKISQSKRGGWIALKADLKQWLQVDLRAHTRITRVATQGRNAFNQWVTRYRVQYSDDGEMFKFFKKASNGSAWVGYFILITSL